MKVWISPSALSIDYTLGLPRTQLDVGQAKPVCYNGHSDTQGPAGWSLLGLHRKGGGASKSGPSCIRRPAFLHDGARHQIDQAFARPLSRGAWCWAPSWALSELILRSATARIILQIRVHTRGPFGPHPSPPQPALHHCCIQTPSLPRLARVLWLLRGAGVGRGSKTIYFDDVFALGHYHPCSSVMACSSTERSQPCPRTVN